MKKIHGKTEVVNVFSVQDAGEVIARFFDANEALGFCRTHKLNTTKNINTETVEIVWLHGSARILGPEIR